MVLIDRNWEDLRKPDRGFDKIRMQTVTVKTNSGIGEGSSKYQRSLSMPASPVGPLTPTTPSPTARKDNVWRSVFNPGSNLATKNIGAEVFDKPAKDSHAPTVYDWLYSGDTRSKHR